MVPSLPIHEAMTWWTCVRADGDSTFDFFHNAMTSAFRRFPSARRSMGVLCRVTDGPAHVVVHMAQAMHIKGTYIHPVPSQNQATRYMGVVGTPKSSAGGTRTHFTSGSFMAGSSRITAELARPSRTAGSFAQSGLVYVRETRSRGAIRQPAELISTILNFDSATREYK